MADEKDKAATATPPKGADTAQATPRASTRTNTAGDTSGDTPGAAKAKAADAQGSGDGGDGGGAKGDRRPLTGTALDKARMRSAGVTEAGADEYEKLGVNPRLDNRLGDQRPFDTGRVKPQQIDGPEVGHFGEHAEQFGAEFEEATAVPSGEAVGMKSEGPHGRGPHGVTVGDEHGQPQEDMATGTDESDPRNPA